jgi:hypothetical protein
MAKINIPEKRTEALYIRLSPSNRAYVEKVANELDISMTSLIDAIIGNARAEEAILDERATMATEG